MEVSGQLHNPTALPRGRRPQYPLDGKMGGPQNRLGVVAKKEIPPLSPLGIEPRSSSA